MDMLTLHAQCAPTVHPLTMAAVTRVESSGNPFAIGVVGGALARQPRTKAEAVATARALEAQGYNFSVGVAQVNRHNLPRYALSYEQAFEPCDNLRVGAAILQDCYERAVQRISLPQRALRAAFSCYYSGNFQRGFRPDQEGQPSYVHKVLRSAAVLEQQQLIPPVSVRRPVEKAGHETPSSPIRTSLQQDLLAP